MNKIKTFFSALLLLVGLSYQLHAEQTQLSSGKKIEEGVQFKTLDRLGTAQPEVVQFFSFYCGTCDAYQKQGIIADINKQLPEEIKIKQYHVNFLGGYSEHLSRLWVVAQLLGVQDKVAPVIYDSIHRRKNLDSESQMKKIFLDVGVDSKEFDNLVDSKNFVVNSMLMQQQKLIQAYDIRFVPSIVVNGKYLIIPNGLDSLSMNAFINDYARVINFLLQKK